MKANYQSIVVILFFLSGIFFTGCKKEGCTDPNSQNYNPKAKKDDGSCIKSCQYNTFSLNRLGDIEADQGITRVSMLFQVLDGNGKGVIGLTNKNRYSLTDYGQEMITNVEADVQIESFGSIPTEINSAIVMDISKSVEGLVGDIKSAAIAFVESSLSEQKIAIYTFDGNINQVIGYTTNKSQLLSAINSISETNLGTSTNLYDALIYVENEMQEDLYSTQSIRQNNILVFTDGRETADPTTEKLNQVKTALEGRVVFVAALKSADLDASTLRNDIASSTHNYFLANSIGDLETKFKEVQSDIEKLSKSVYWMYYTSPRKGNKYWDIELSIKENCNTGSSAVATGSYSSSGF